MEFRTFGNTDLAVSAISLDCRVFHGHALGDFANDDALTLMRAGYDLGVTFFECPDTCGDGRTQTLLGQFSRQVGRYNIQIGGTFGHDFRSSTESHVRYVRNFSPQFMRVSLEQSLTRLGTDCIDAYFAHNIKLPQFSDELFAELEKVRDEGKIRVWGVGLGPGIGWREEGIDALLNRRAKAIQCVYNVFQQDPTREFAEAARTVHAGLLVHDCCQCDSRPLHGEGLQGVALQKFEKIRHYAADHDMTLRQFACKWVLANPTVTSVTGAFADEQQVRQAVEALDKPLLTRRELDELAQDYDNDWGLGEQAHPPDLQSSTHPTGRVRSGYRPLPIALA